MSLGSNRLLRCQYMTAYFAMASLGFTCCRTCCGNSEVNHGRMSKCRNFYLCRQNLAAIDTFETLGQSGCCTSSVYSIDNCCVVFQDIKLFLRREYFLANLAMRAIT